MNPTVVETINQIDSLIASLVATKQRLLTGGHMDLKVQEHSIKETTTVDSVVSVDVASLDKKERKTGATRSKAYYEANKEKIAERRKQARAKKAEEKKKCDIESSSEELKDLKTI